MAEALPLFPLGAVLFPGVVLPLHVFEARYRALVRDLMTSAAQSGRPEFGVVAIRAGHEVGDGAAGGEGTLHAVGCIAVLREVGELEDGRYSITSVGGARFRLRGIAASAGTPYLTGLVDRLEEADGVGADVYAGAVARRFADYRRRLGLEGPEPTQLAQAASPRQLSYLVAASMVLAERERQTLLECADAATRLEAELALLTQEIAMVDALSCVPDVSLAREPFAPN